MGSFQVFTRGMPARAEEWLKALNVPVSDLPRLTDDERRRAGIRRLSEEQYARHILLRASARDREDQEGKLLGDIIVDLLKELSGDFSLKSVVKRGLEPGWHALIEYRVGSAVDRLIDLVIPTEDFSDQPGSRVISVGDVDEVRDYVRSVLRGQNIGAVAS